MRYTAFLPAGLLVAISSGLASTPTFAQDSTARVPIYERETFTYDRAGRIDPFKPLLSDTETGFRIEDLSLLGIVHHPDPEHSIAILARSGRKERIRARMGDRFGTLRIAAIHSDRVDIVLEELGVARRETLHLQKKHPEDRER